MSEVAWAYCAGMVFGVALGVLVGWNIPATARWLNRRVFKRAANGTSPSDS